MKRFIRVLAARALPFRGESPRAQRGCTTKRLAFLAVVALLLGSQSVRGDYIPFSGSGNSGTISTTPPATVPWSVVPAVSPFEAEWGIPDPGKGTTRWTGSGTETEFTVTFTDLPASDEFDLDLTGFEDVTHTTTQFWSLSVSTDGLTATFTAPTGEPLNPGDIFFVTIAFSSAPSSNGVTFTGAFDPQLATTATPEPASLTLLGLGAAGLISYGWRRKWTA